MTQQPVYKKSACEHCTASCSKKARTKPIQTNVFEKLAHKILKATPLGCDGESWRCFLKSKHMFLYATSAVAFFVTGSLTNVIFERKLGDLLFDEKQPEVLHFPKKAFDPDTKQYFEVKNIIENLETGEKTAVLNKMPAYPTKKVSSYKGFLLLPQEQKQKQEQQKTIF